MYIILQNPYRYIRWSPVTSARVCHKQNTVTVWCHWHCQQICEHSKWYCKSRQAMFPTEVNLIESTCMLIRGTQTIHAPQSGKQTLYKRIMCKFYKKNTQWLHVTVTSIRYERVVIVPPGGTIPRPSLPRQSTRVVEWFGRWGGGGGGEGIYGRHFKGCSSTFGNNARTVSRMVLSI